MDDVPDYMSAVFLQEAEPSKGDKRRNKLKRKRQPADKIKPAQEIQQERLEQGELNQVLSQHNRTAESHWFQQQRFSDVDENGLQVCILL